MKLLSTLAVMGAMRTLSEKFRNSTGIAIEADFAPTVGLLERIRAGARADVAILTGQGIDDLIAEGTMRPGSRADVALSFVGIAVRAGAPKPDISTVESFRSAMLEARRVAVSKIGASGILFAGLLEQMGIASSVNTLVVPSGFTAEQLVNNEADLAVQQISELLVVKGIEVVGPLPAELATPAMFSGGILTGADDEAAARSFLAFLTGPEAAPVLTEWGLRPA